MKFNLMKRNVSGATDAATLINFIDFRNGQLLTISSSLTKIA